MQNNSLIKRVSSDQHQDRQRNTYWLFFPPEIGLMKKISLVLWQWLMSINLGMSMLFAEHTVRTGVLCGIICALVIKITLIWGELSTLPFPSLQQLPRLFSAFFFFSFLKRIFFFTASRNFHYIVPSLHSCCPKCACHQWICAHIHHGEKLLAGLFISECSSQNKPV